MIILGVLFLLLEPFLRSLIPKAVRGKPLTSLAMGLSLFVAATLPNLLPPDLTWAFHNRFLWGLLYLPVSVFGFYSIFTRLLARWKIPRHAGWLFVILVGVELPLAAWSEYSQAASSSVSGGTAVAAARQAPQRPNVLLLVFDTLRFDTLRQEWNGQKQFPVLDEFTQDGVFFTRGYSGCNVTPGGHSTLLTGMLPAETGTLARGLVRLDDKYLTIAEFLRQYGYRTGATVTNARLSGRFGYRQGFEVYDDGLVNPLINLVDVGERLSLSCLTQLFGAPYSRRLVSARFHQLSWTKGVANAADTTATALRMVDEMGIGIEEPWFLFLNYIDPHTPYVTRKDLAEAFGPNIDNSEMDRLRNNVMRFSAHLQQMSRDLLHGEDRQLDLDWLQEAYREQCLELDEEVAGLLQGLRERELLDDNTLILITSDHGEHLGEHGEFNHGGSLNDEEVRVPFLLLGPGVSAGTVTTPVSGADFFCTVTYAMGLEESAIPVTSGVPLQTPIPGRVIRFEHADMRGFLVGNQKMVARDENGELHWFAAFDLEQDPRELHNLIDDGLEWVEVFRRNPPIESSQDANLIEIGDGSIDLAELGYAEEMAH